MENLTNLYRSAGHARRPFILLRRLGADTTGTAVIEAALVLPILLVLLIGIFNFGQYLMIAHSVQQVANEAARAAVAGLDETDRKNLVSQTMAASAALSGTVDEKLITASSELDGSYYTVFVRYDTSQNKSLNMGIVPLPVGPIQRHSTVRLVYQ